MITLVDSPPLSALSMSKLIDAFIHALANGSCGVSPEHNGKRGHPLLANQALINAFLAAPATSNARAVKHAHAAAIVSVAVTDSLLTVDVNTPEEYAALSQSESKPS
jgi:molybdenum cofactor cytidylyltransferase